MKMVRVNADALVGGNQSKGTGSDGLQKRLDKLRGDGSDASNTLIANQLEGALIISSQLSDEDVGAAIRNALESVLEALGIS